MVGSVHIINIHYISAHFWAWLLAQAGIWYSSQPLTAKNTWTIVPISHHPINCIMIGWWRLRSCIIPLVIIASETWVDFPIPLWFPQKKYCCLRCSSWGNRKQNCVLTNLHTQCIDMQYIVQFFRLFSQMWRMIGAFMLYPESTRPHKRCTRQDVTQ